MKNTTSVSRTLRLLPGLALTLAAFALGALAPSAFAANYAWDTSPSSANLNTGNWTSGTTPGSGTSTPASGSSLYFGVSSQTSPVNNFASGFGIAGITFNSGASTYTFSGSTSNALTGNIVNSSTSLQTINFPMGLTAARTVTLTSGGGDVTLGGVISGASYNLSTSGSGTLTLNGVNKFGSSGSATMTIASGTTLTIGGAGQLNSGAYARTITDNGTLNYNSSAAQTLSGIISGTGALTQNGSGNLTLSAYNTFTGNTVINGGTLTLNAGANQGNSATVEGTLTINPGATVEAAQPDCLGADVFALGSTTYTKTVNINGGTLDISAGSAYSEGLDTTFNLTGGKITSSGGAKISQIGTTGALSSDLGVINSLATNVSSVVSAPILLYGASGVVFTTAQGTVPSGMDLIISSVISDGGSGYTFTKAGAGVLALTAANTYTGNTIISAGTLQLGDGVSANGSVAGNIDDQTTLVFANPTAQTYAGTIYDGGSVVKTGAGVLTLSGANSYSGSTTVSNGTLIVNAAQNSYGPVTVADGATLGVTASADQTYWYPSSLTLGSSTGATLSFGALGTASPLLYVLGPLTLNGPTTINITSCPSDATSLPLISFSSIGGSGYFVRGSLPPGVTADLTTNGNTIYLNVTTGAASFLWTGLNNTNWDKTTTNNWSNNGASAVYADGAPVQFDDTSAQTNVNVAVTVAPSVMIVSNNTDHYTFSSAAAAKITGGAGLTKNGNGTLTLAGLNSDFTGGVNINAGVVEVSGVTNLGSASGTVLLNGGALSVVQSFTNSQTLTVATTNGSGNCLLSVAAGQTFDVPQVIGNSGGGVATLVKQGAGTMQLDAYQTNFAGGVVVNGGTLALTAGGASACVPGTLTINQGATVELDASSGNALGALLPSYGWNGPITSPVNIVGGTLDIGVSENSSQDDGLSTTYNLTGGRMTSSGGGNWSMNGGAAGGPAGAINSLATNVSSTISGSILLWGQNGVVITTDAGTVPSGIDLNISGVINDGGSGYGFTKAGPGVLALTAANTYTGNTVISGGALQLGDGVSAIGSVAGNIDDQATLVFANPSDQAYAGVVSDYGSVVKTGAGTLTLSGANTYSGSTTVSNGTAVLAASGSLGYSYSASVAGGALLVTAPQTTFSGSVTVNDGASLGVTASADAVYLSPYNLTLGNTTGATLNFGAVGTVNPLLNVGTLTLNGNTTINITSCPSLPESLPLISFGSITGSGNFVRGSLPPGVVANLVTNGNTIYLNMTTGTASFEWTGLNNTNWDKATTNNWLDNGVSGLYGDGAPVQFDDTSARTNVNVAVTVAPSAMVVTNNTRHYTFSSAAGAKITDGASLTKNGNGTLTLTNLNSDFTGGVTINAGVVEVSGAANLGSASGTVLLNGGTLSVLQSYTNSQTLSVNTATGSGSGLLSVAAGQTFNVPNVIGNSGGGVATLVKQGAGALQLDVSEPNFNGGTVVNAGTLTLTANSCVPGTLAINPGALVECTVADALGTTIFGGTAYTSPINIVGGTLDNAMSAGNYNGLDTTFNLTGGHMTCSGGGTFSMDGGASGIDVTAGAINTFATNVSSTISGSIELWDGNGVVITTAAGTVPSGIDLNISAVIIDGIGLSGNAAGTSSGFTKAGPGVLALTAANTYSGDTTNSAGVLQLGDGVSANGSVAGNIDNQATLVFANPSAQTYAGTIYDVGSVIKTAAGVLTLTGTNTYTGTTTMSNGTLQVNGLIASAVAVNGGALAGTGTIGDAVTVNANGSLAPQNSGSGALTISGNLTLNAGSTNTFTVDGNSLANDAVVLGGNATYGGVLNIVPSGVFTSGQQFTLFSGAGAANASNFASITGSPGANMAFSFTNGVLSVVSTAPAGPILTSVTPNPVPGSSYPVTLSLTGSGFVSGCTVNLTNLTTVTGYNSLPATFNSSTSLSVAATLGTAASSWNATMVNPDTTTSGQAGFTVSAPTSVQISNASVSSAGAGKVVLTGNGGAPGNSYAVLSATNLNPPVVWTPVVTNTFDGSGNFAYTNTVNTGTVKLFLLIQQ